MVSIPGLMALNVPVGVIVVTEASEQLHIPPAAVSDSVVVLVAHRVDKPEIIPASGTALTVKFRKAESAPHTFSSLYIIVVVPAEIPETMPSLSIVAINKLLELHNPEGMLWDKLVIIPAHTIVSPKIGGIGGLNTEAVEGNRSDIFRTRWLL